jgi:PRTRC genetic system protein B
MNTLTDNLICEFKPILAITVYGVADGAGDYYLESHDINDKGEVLAGKPLEQSTLQGIVDVFFDERKNMSRITGMIPDNLLAFELRPGGGYKMIWWRPAEKRVLQHTASLKIPTDNAWIPALIYSVEHNSLTVYALENDTRPQSATKLFHAPFFNVDDDGDVCLGNANVKKPKDPSYTDIMKYWEDLFWLSEFSHVNGEEKIKSGDLAEFWRKLLKRNCSKKWSDIDQLIPTKKTLKTIINA